MTKRRDQAPYDDAVTTPAHGLAHEDLAHEDLAGGELAEDRIAEQDLSGDLVERTAAQIRVRLTEGGMAPGEQLPEPALAHELGISRNTLREAFRVLIHDGLLERLPHRGVFVIRPTVAGVLDVYRVRRLIEGQAVRQAMPGHPAISRARRIVEEARLAAEQGAWRVVGTKNMEFHAAIVSLADSDRLDALFDRLQAELRLAFASLPSPEHLHAPFVGANSTIVALLEEGRTEDAGVVLDRYFTRSERTVLAALSRS